MNRHFKSKRRIVASLFCLCKEPIRKERNVFVFILLLISMINIGSVSNGVIMALNFGIPDIQALGDFTNDIYWTGAQRSEPNLFNSIVRDYHLFYFAPPLRQKDLSDKGISINLGTAGWGSGWDYYSSNNKKGTHLGTDFNVGSNYLNTPVYAVCKGMIKEVFIDPNNWGLHTILEHRVDANQELPIITIEEWQTEAGIPILVYDENGAKKIGYYDGENNVELLNGQEVFPRRVNRQMRKAGIEGIEYIYFNYIHIEPTFPERGRGENNEGLNISVEKGQEIGKIVVIPNGASPHLHLHFRMTSKQINFNDSTERDALFKGQGLYQKEDLKKWYDETGNLSGMKILKCGFAETEYYSGDPLTLLYTLKTIPDIEFIRDVDDGLNSRKIKISGKVKIIGANFGDNSGSVEIIPDLSLNPEFFTCENKPPLEYSVVTTDQGWSDTEIIAEIFPHNYSVCGKEFHLHVDSLDLPVLIRVKTADGRVSKVLPFPFKDIKDHEEGNDNVWYARYVTNVWREGIVNGYKREFFINDGEKALNIFGAGNEIQQNEIIKMAVIASGNLPIENPTCECLTVEDDWSKGFVCKALELDWLDYNSDCPLDPLKKASRGFVCYLIARARGVDVNDVSGTNFPDIPTSHKYYKHILFIKNLGIVHGYPNGNFEPDRKMNRAEVAKVLWLTFHPEDIE